MIELKNGSVLERATPQRHHSSALVSSFQKWMAGIDWAGLSSLKNLKDAWIPHIEAVSMEGAFLGFTRVVRLCRAVFAALETQASSDKSLTDDQKQILRTCLSAIETLIQRPYHETTLSLQRMVHELQDQFSLTENQLALPIIAQMQSAARDLTTDSVEQRLNDLEHRDLDVYRNSRLDSLDQCFEEETWIVSQIASLAEDLASGTSSGHPAARLMHVLRGHKFFNQVDRVCLAGRVNDANQLVVVDSSASERCPENTLKKGYSCFVNPNGSLFKMRPGTLRIFADCERVLASFAEQNKPAQRSIALISDQGLRSGLCLAIGRGTDIQGFLFLNSVEKDLFKNITVSFAPLLSLFGLVGTIGLDTNGFHVSSSKGSSAADAVPRVSTVFEPANFVYLIEQSLAVLQGPVPTPTIAVKQQTPLASFLYLPNTIVTTVAEIIYRLRQNSPTSSRVTVDVRAEQGEVQMSIPHDKQVNDIPNWRWLSHMVGNLDAGFANKPVHVRLTDSSIIVGFPYEPLLFGQTGSLYSTVY